MSKAELSLKHLRKSFGTKVVLNDLNYEFHKGITALIGRNGSGKSTLIRCLSSQILPTGGQIVFEKNVLPGEQPWKRARRGFAWTFQEMDAPITLKIGTLLDLSEKASNLAPAAALASRDLIRTSLDPLIDRVWHTLSFGQRKFAALAIAALRRPKVLLLDEPVSGLSQSLTDTVSLLLKKMIEEGCAVIFAEHNRSFIEETASSAVVLSNGEIVYSGSAKIAFQSKSVLDALI